VRATPPREGRKWGSGSAKGRSRSRSCCSRRVRLECASLRCRRAENAGHHSGVGSSGTASRCHRRFDPIQRSRRLSRLRRVRGSVRGRGGGGHWRAGRLAEPFAAHKPDARGPDQRARRVPGRSFGRRRHSRRHCAYTHPSNEGNELIADVLADLAFAPLA
jgi:hypothetical protein